MFEGKEKVITNQEWINVYCTTADIAQLNRMFLHDLNTKGPGIEAPMWEKSAYWDKWIHETFNAREWKRAYRDKGDAGVPNDFYQFNSCRYGAKQLA